MRVLKKNACCTMADDAMEEDLELQMALALSIAEVRVHARSPPRHGAQTFF